MRRIIMASITAVVVIAVLAGTLIPVLDDATAKTDTFTNDGYFRMSHYDATTNHTIAWAYSNPSVFTIDGEDVNVAFTVKNSSCTIIADTNWLVRYFTDDNGAGRAVRLVLSTGEQYTALSDSTDLVTLTLSEGTLAAVFSLSGGTVSKSSTYTDVYVPDNDGEYVMKNASSIAYVKGDSELFGFGLTQLNTSNGTQAAPGTGFAFEGTYDDGVTGAVWLGSDVTISNIVVNATANADHLDLYEFNSITATATYDSTDTALTYNYIIVPYEVTAERSVHFTDGENAIFNAIPVIVIVALLLGVVAIVLRSRMD